MKKVSWKFVLAQIAGVLLVSFVIALIICFKGAGVSRMDLVGPFTFVVSVMVGAIYLGFSGILTNKLMNNTIEKNEEKYNFENCCTFYSSNATIMIDQVTGRIAFVARQNPFEFQVYSARGIDRIKSDYIKGVLGGTNYVYFEFYYEGKRVRIPTFTATKQMYSLKSTEVLEGISKADAYAEILQNAKAAAV